LYALIAGHKVNERTQYAITKAIHSVEAKMAGQHKTRVMSIDLTASGPRLCFGIKKVNILG
jgi:hypothetical protein